LRGLGSYESSDCLPPTTRQPRLSLSGRYSADACLKSLPSDSLRIVVYSRAADIARNSDTVMDKDWIISEIKRTALENGGVALGVQKFQKVTGIKKTEWWIKHWRGWGEALKEAGFSPNKLNAAHDRTFLVICLAKLTRSIGRFPADVDLRLARKDDDAFPEHKTFRNLGLHHQRIALVRKYATEHEEYADILRFLPRLKEMEETPGKDVTTNTKTNEGFVYLGMLRIGSGKRYKIGKTNLVERRSTELSLQLPEKLELVHYIRTDDMSGIEAYWHRRFADKNTNGEWFDLSSDEVRAFKLRKFM
jgi:Meiotically up-regulated gene 113